MKFLNNSTIVHSLSEFRRDIQEIIGTKANLDFGLKLENYGGETFLDDTVSASLIQETKSAILRCQTVRKLFVVFFYHLHVFFVS